ncbi:hypothetical protein HLH26_04665 [Gluconacetobacter sp. 1b LMG 1731]|uniref:Uncharacterized protein n=2 Tax=Gluconacetobacter dulcium TaxID=2729096 RepID=A0A7W4IJ59_9PROT|nr:hypothetical protein [Gluconacetobacter dulcium]MBB2193162.1 hypothetical protein [Gluconacetobacter dulcium]
MHFSFMTCPGVKDGPARSRSRGFHQAGSRLMSASAGRPCRTCRRGGLIGAPNDPSNESRPLRLLKALGRIKLAPSAGLLPTALDIADTPRNLSVKELDAAIVNTNRAFKSGLQIDRQSILTRHHAIDATIMQAGMIEGSMQMQVKCVARLSEQDEAAMDFLRQDSPSMETMEMVLAPVLIAAFSMGEPGALQARKLWPSLLLMIVGITLTGVGASGHSADGTSDWAHRAEGIACAASALGS